MRTWLGSSERDVSHPSYQAWDYSELLRNFNEGVYASEITLRPCAYLHTYERDDHIDHEFYGLLIAALADIARARHDSGR